MLVLVPSNSIPLNSSPTVEVNLFGPIKLTANSFVPNSNGAKLLATTVNLNKFGSISVRTAAGAKAAWVSAPVTVTGVLVSNGLTKT